VAAVVGFIGLRPGLQADPESEDPGSTEVAPPDVRNQPEIAEP
jgi:hypothetical protein